MQKKRLGRWGEETAAQWLMDLGYRIVARNFATPFGEIDIVARRGGELYSIEVKTRSTVDFGTPAAAVTARKLEHMRRATEAYLGSVGWSGAVCLGVVEVDAQGACHLITEISLP